MPHANPAPSRKSMLEDKLKKPTLLMNRKMALTFIPDAEDQKPIRAQIEIASPKMQQMLTQLRSGKVRLQIATGFDERDIVFDNGAEILFLYQMLDDFITGLPEAQQANGA